MEEFDNVVIETQKITSKMLIDKGLEYATSEDRLHNFRDVAAFNNEPMERTLWGMLSKHLKSLSDMVKNPKEFSPAMWDEKIMDAINYLTMLRAIRAENRKEMCEPCNDGMSGIKVVERR